MRAATIYGIVVVLFSFTTTLRPNALPQASETGPAPVILSVQMKNGKPLYKLNGKIVEDRKENSLLTRLGEVVNARGTNIPAFIILDVHAPFTEADKLGTALDKMDITRGRKLFVANYGNGMMNELHIDDAAVRLPQ